MLTREQIATRAARELQTGESVHLDEGLPRLLASHLPEGVRLAESDGSDVDVAVLSATRVGSSGEFVGSALRRGAKRVVVLLEQHAAGDASHVLAQCEQPTGQATRIITDMAVFDVTPEGLVMREVAPDISAHDVQLKSGTPLLAADDLKVMNV